MSEWRIVQKYTQLVGEMVGYDELVDGLNLRNALKANELCGLQKILSAIRWGTAAVRDKSWLFDGSNTIEGDDHFNGSDILYSLLYRTIIEISHLLLPHKKL
jgi:hypothetical protein